MHAVFGREGGLAEATLFVGARFTEVGPKLRSAYPDYLPNADGTVHFVNRQAQGHEMVAITGAPSIARPGSSIVQLRSMAAMDAPPF